MPDFKPEIKAACPGKIPNSPSLPGTVTESTVSLTTLRSGVTISNFKSATFEELRITNYELRMSEF
jgi:hypothetical protein